MPQLRLSARKGLAIQFGPNFPLYCVIVPSNQDYSTLEHVQYLQGTARSSIPDTTRIRSDPSTISYEFQSQSHQWSLHQTDTFIVKRLMRSSVPERLTRPKI